MSKKRNNSPLELDIEHLHHAYLLVGGAGQARDAVEGFFAAHEAKLVGSPDYFVFTEALLGIDDARRLSEQAIRRAFGERKIFFLAPEKITLEAQNALLKTFEEPIGHTYFFLALRDENLAIPTLRSRVQILRLEPGDEKKSQARQFLASTPKERLNFAKKFVEAEKNLSAFLDELLLELRSGSGRPGNLEQVYRMRLSSDDRGASPRLILEHLSTVLPG